jgi:hypothetical protein
LYISVARKLRIPSSDDDQADIKQLVKHCVAEVSVRQCLLVFVNVEDTTVRPSSLLLTSEVADLSVVLLHSKLCSVIFTITESEIAEALALRNVTALQELTPEAALRMFQNRLTSLLSNAEQQRVSYLLREQLYLPLAVI